MSNQVLTNLHLLTSFLYLVIFIVSTTMVVNKDVYFTFPNLV